MDQVRLRYAAKHSTPHHTTAQHSTAQHSTVQYSTAQHSTTQHYTALVCLCVVSVLITALSLPSSSIFHISPLVSSSVCSLQGTESLVVIYVVDLPLHPPYLDLRIFFLSFFVLLFPPPLLSPPQLSSPHPSTSPLSRKVLALHERFLDTCLKQCLLASQVCHCVRVCVCVCLCMYVCVCVCVCMCFPSALLFIFITPYLYNSSIRFYHSSFFPSLLILTIPFPLSFLSLGPLEDPH